MSSPPPVKRSVHPPPVSPDRRIRELDRQERLVNAAAADALATSSGDLAGEGLHARVRKVRAQHTSIRSPQDTGQGREMNTYRADRASVGTSPGHPANATGQQAAGAEHASSTEEDSQSSTSTDEEDDFEVFTGRSGSSASTVVDIRNYGRETEFELGVRLSEDGRTAHVDIHRYRQRIRKEYRNHADAIEITSRNLFLTSEIIETVVATALKHMADVCAIKHSFVISLIYGIKLLGIDYDVLSYRNKPDSDNSDDDEPVLAIVVATSTSYHLP